MGVRLTAGKKSAGTLKVLIVGYYGFENAGDEAILRAIVIDLRERHARIGVTRQPSISGMRIRGC